MYPVWIGELSGKSGVPNAVVLSALTELTLKGCLYAP